MKMVIVRQGDTYIGYTYDDGWGFCQANFLGNYNETSKLLTGKGMGFIRHSITHSQSRFRLVYSREGNEHFLEGVLLPKTTVTTIFSFGMSEKVSLKRTSLSVDTTDFMRNRLNKNQTPVDQSTPDSADGRVINFEQAPLFKIPSPGTDTSDKDNIITARQTRRVDTISTIFTSEKTITISIFDNGQIDGDTVTVFHNNELLLSRHFVSAIPYKITISISKEHPRHELLLVANNLGSIPPNTAVLLVDSGDKQYRLTASSDLNKNALLIFEYRDDD